MGVDRCEEISLPTRVDDRGVLVFLEEQEQIPFDVKRIFYIYEIPEGVTRGEHAHRSTEQFLLPLSGGVTVVVDDGAEETEYRCDSPTTGLYLPGGIWTTLSDFTEDTVLLVLASTRYDEDEYIHGYDEFLEWRDEDGD